MQFVAKGMEALGLLRAAAVAPAGRGEDREVDAAAGDLFGFLLVCANDQRLADECDSHRVSPFDGSLPAHSHGFGE